MSQENTTSKQPLIRYVNRQQMSWRAVDVEHLIGEDHPARAIWALVGRLKRPLSLSFSRGDFYLASDVVLWCSGPFKAELFPSRGAVSGSLLRLWIQA